MADIQAVTLIDQQGNSFVDVDQVVDAAGNRFVAIGEAQTGQNNITWVTVMCYAPSGAISGQWTIDPSTNHKIDKLSITHTGQDLLLALITHQISDDSVRSIRVESAVIPGVFTDSAGLDQEIGGPGAFTGDQRFADVPVGSTFYPFVEFLVSKGAIGGYPCGGPGQPCDAQNRPYFLPGNPLTRGQISKIIALALDFNPG
ncbi:MAG TPA: S-layer homology domain-containing protein [Chloroflexia bacterium]|nr:S-layer homology domain-containing protein [Chloroflexia bacterium]